MQTQYDSIQLEKFSSMSSYHDIREQLDRLSADFRTYLTKPEYLVPFLQPGRLVKVRYQFFSFEGMQINSLFIPLFMQVKNEQHTFDWGIIVNFKKKNPKNPEKEKTTIVVDILLHVSKDSTESVPKPCPEGEEGEAEVVPVLHTLVSQISSLRVYYPKDLRPPDNRKSVLKTIQEVKKRFPEGPPLLNPITDMRIEDSGFKDIIKRIEVLEERLFEHPMHKVSLQLLFCMLSSF